MDEMTDFPSIKEMTSCDSVDMLPKYGIDESIETSDNDEFSGVDQIVSDYFSFIDDQEEQGDSGSYSSHSLPESPIEPVYQNVNEGFTRIAACQNFDSLSEDASSTNESLNVNINYPNISVTNLVWEDGVDSCSLKEVVAGLNAVFSDSALKASSSMCSPSKVSSKTCIRLGQEDVPAEDPPIEPLTCEHGRNIRSEEGDVRADDVDSETGAVAAACGKARVISDAGKSEFVDLPHDGNMSMFQLVQAAGFERWEYEEPPGSPSGRSTLEKTEDRPSTSGGEVEACRLNQALNCGVLGISEKDTILNLRSSDSELSESSDTPTPRVVRRCAEEDSVAGSSTGQQDASKGTEGVDGLGKVSIGQAIRRSLRRMRRFRLSQRGSSEEERGPQRVPESPPVGLPTVRSPSTNAILISSLLASLSPVVSPREVLDDFDQQRHGRRQARRQRSPSGVSPLNFPPSEDPYDSAPPPPYLTQQTTPSAASPPQRTQRLTPGRQTNHRSHQADGRRGRTRRSPPQGSRPQSPSSTPRASEEADPRLTPDRTGEGADSGVNTPTRETPREGESSPRRTTPQRQRSVPRRPPRRRLWSHRHSGLMATLAVTVTPFNISRFAVLGARFGWPFIVQWLLVSLVLGLPLMAFHASVGQHIGAGVLSMWKVSPIFKGVGLSMLLVQVVLGVYCSTPIAWLFIYFRDSFVTSDGRFRWADCAFTDFNCTRSLRTNSDYLIKNIPQYFNSKILHRNEGSSWLEELASLRFDLAFNTILVWLITFLALSRGTRSYGTVAYIIILIPLMCYFVVCLYFVAWSREDQSYSFDELFLNSTSWMAASREAFLVWALHSAVIQQMAAHNRKGHSLYRDTSFLTVITVLALTLAAATGSSCMSSLYQENLQYKTSSFETVKSSQFLEKALDSSELMDSINIPNRINIVHYATKNFPNYMTHFPGMGGSLRLDNFYLGIRIRTAAEDHLSGYQAFQLATEMFPALLSVHSEKEMLPFLASLFYLSLLLFGIGYLMAVWRTVVESIVQIKARSLHRWESFIAFCTCVFGFSAALPLATGHGLDMLFFIDYVVACGWWLMIIQLVQLFALLFVRGKPFSSHDIVKEFMGRKENCCSLWIGALTSFAWSIIVPVGLLVLSISSFKAGNYREVFIWKPHSYWPVWACQLASALQLLPILLVPLVGLVQTCRYIASPLEDLVVRIQQLYRPKINMNEDARQGSSSDEDDEYDLSPTGNESAADDETGPPRPYSDPPPKYTPPPSYSTATGLKFAKNLRRSIRYLRGERRGAGSTVTESGDQCNSSSSVAEQVCTQSRDSSPPPPLYATLDPLQRANAQAALSNLQASVKEDSADDNRFGDQISRSSLRNLTSGIRRSARRLATLFSTQNQVDRSSLIQSSGVSIPISSISGSVDPDLSHPHVYTNLGMQPQSEA